MTDQKSPETPQTSQVSEEQIQLLRSSLIQMAFSKYGELIEVLKKLPIPQQIPGIVQAYLFIDSGMLWFKEILNTAPLIFTTAPAMDEKKDEETACDAKPEMEAIA